MSDLANDSADAAREMRLRPRLQLARALWPIGLDDDSMLCLHAMLRLLRVRTRKRRTQVAVELGAGERAMAAATAATAATAQVSAQVSALMCARAQSTQLGPVWQRLARLPLARRWRAPPASDICCFKINQTLASGALVLFERIITYSQPLVSAAAV